MKIFKTSNGAIYEKPCFDSQYTDETVFGTEATVLEECGRWLKVRTFYGYEGYVTSDSVGDGEVGEYVVCAHHTDVLPAPEYQYAPILSISKGARVVVCEAEDHGRFFKVELPDGEIGYVRKSSLKKYCDFGEGEFGDRVVKTAKEYLGAIYRWGGKSFSGIDCSGLAFMSYYLNGAVIWRDADTDKMTMLRETTLDKIKAGDLIFFPGHVAISLGGLDFIHATAGGNGRVSIERLGDRLKTESVTGVYTLKTE